ncbi:bacteriohemerythrin [Sulfurivermis fontis]|uniref:bacteriohemerythrin n=1 Tax=Sulfurivermis fontis TaxID=1972068 RepID=UPI00155904E4|nr:hemerythrin family protein [Sulfurivermis fontis]
MADLIEWQSHLNLGIAALDYQHRELADLLNLLAATLHADTTLDPVALLQRIHRDAHDHFLYEEKLMLSSGFRAHIAHQREHTMLLGELKLLSNAVSHGETALDAALLHSLRDWLIAHIVTSDREFAVHYIQVTNDQ